MAEDHVTISYPWNDALLDILRNFKRYKAPIILNNKYYLEESLKWDFKFIVVEYKLIDKPKNYRD